MTSNVSSPAPGSIALVVLDFDGVLTDNRVLTLDDGREAVFCSRADGMGIDLLRAAGIDVLILSTETNPVVAARARKLKVPVYQGVKDKASALTEILRERAVDASRVMYVGNDVNDLDAMRSIGWPVSPADGHLSVRSTCRYVTRSPGGHGVVREIADFIGATRL